MKPGWKPVLQTNAIMAYAPWVGPFAPREWKEMIGRTLTEMVRLWNEFETSRPLVTKPFCDQSHKNTDFKPLRFYIQDPVKSVNLCGCKLSINKPLCDGTHAKI